MFQFILSALLALNSIASELSWQSGFIEAHTEVFGDNHINPSTNNIDSNLQIEDSLESIQGVITIETLNLKSDNQKRDINMYELLNNTLYPNITFQFSSISFQENRYSIEGFLTLNGIKKPIVSSANISEDTNTITLLGSFSINLSDYGIEPPSMFFVTVRDQIDISYNLHYKKK